MSVSVSCVDAYILGPLLLSFSPSLCRILCDMLGSLSVEGP